MTEFSNSISTLDIDIRDQWNSGLVVDVDLTPLQSLSGWAIAFDYPGEIVNIWNARIVSRDGDRYVVENMPYNASVGAGATTGFGFQGAGSSSDITAVSINGAPFDGAEAGEEPEPTPLPDISISDAVGAEEDGTIEFVVALSSASDTDVTATLQTLQGSAQEGSDFTPLQSEIVIPAGQTSAVVTVELTDDSVPEDLEQFRVQLTGATGANISDGVATGQITDSDTPAEPTPDPVVSLGDTSAVEGDPGAANTGSGGIATELIVDGPLSTSGNQILDANGNAVQIRAVNWFGAENNVRAPHGLWQRPMTEMMDQMVDEGFNAIRLPFSVQNILEDLPATSVAGDPSLAGLTTLEIFDRIVAYAEQIGIKIILDAHRVTQGNGAEGIWYSGQYDEADWIAAWELLANRYGDSDAVIGADLLNEPHLGTWGTGQRNDWPAAAEQAGNAVLDIAPDWLILVEGIGNYQGNNYWWGGQLQGVRDRPVVLNTDDKLVYSPHDYPASIFNQPWFNDGSDLYEVFRENWGFIFEEGIAPVLLGEFGSRLENPLDLVWADAITDYLSGDFNGDGVNDLQPGQAGPSFAWWSWNPNSGDTGGYVLDDWTTVRQNAADLLAPFLDDQGVEGTGDGDAHSNVVPLVFDVTLDAPAAEPVTYAYETRDGTATAGSDYVAATGTVGFAPGQQVAKIQVEVLPDTVPEENETLTLVLTDLDGTEIAATGTILDDDLAALDPDPVDPDPVDPDPVDPDPVDPDPVDPDPVDPDPMDPMDGGDDQGGTPPTNGSYALSLDDWGSGFVARFTFTPDTAVSGGWTARIATTATVTNIWNADIVSHENGVLTITHASWNASIGAGQTIEVGFQGNGSSSGLGLIDTSFGAEGDATDPADPDPVDPGDGDMGSGDIDSGDMGDGGGMDAGDSGGGGTGGGSGGGGSSGPFVGGGQTYSVGQSTVVTGFDPTRDVLDLGPGSIHNQIPVDTPDGFMMLHMFNPGQSLLLEEVRLADLHPENFAPIADSHLQQDLSAALAYEDGSGFLRPNTVYVRSHEEGVQEIVDFNPTTDKISFFYLSVRGDGQLNFAVEQTAEGARFYSPLTGQSITLSGISFSDLDSSHFEWRANQLEDGIAGRMGLESVIDGFTYPNENIFSGKSVAMAGGVDRAPYHSSQGYEDYTGTPIGTGTSTDDGGTGDGMDNGGAGDGMGGGMTGGDTGDGMGGGSGDGEAGDGGDTGGSGDSGPFVGGGQTYSVGQTQVVTGFDPTRDVLDLGPNSIHNQIPVDTPDGFMMLHMFNASQSLLLEGVSLADLHPESFAPILDSHLQQDMSAALAYADGSGLVRPNTVYIRSHQQGLEESVDFNPATDKISFFYLSVRGDGQLNFAAEQTAEGARFYSPLTGQSMTLRGISFSELDSSHFEWRSNQLEDGIAGRMGLDSLIDGFSYPSTNIFSGKSVAMAGGVDRAPYHSQPDYTGTPIGAGTDPVDDGAGSGGSDDDPVAETLVVTVTGGSVTEGDPGVDHIHEDGSTHVHDDGHRYITFTISLDAPAAEEISLTYTTADGTAAADTQGTTEYDYHAISGTLVFSPGDQTQNLVVSVHPDTIVEDSETFTLRISGEQVSGIIEATGTIIDNDVEDVLDDGMGGDGTGGDSGHDMDHGSGDHSDHDHGQGSTTDTFTDITAYGTFHGSSSHTDHGELAGGRTAITTEAMIAYNGLRDFLGLADVTQEVVGQWAFDEGLTNNTQPYGQDLQGVGLWYAMQGAKVGWIRDDAFDPQILADIQREARLGDPAIVMTMVEQYGHVGFADYLMQNGLFGHFVETLKMEPHYGGWMHGRTHGWLNLPEGAIAHDVNHLTVLSHDQTQPFMNDTFDWPQWPALNVPEQDVIDYFQSMVVLGDPLGDALPADGTAPAPVDEGTAPPPIDPVEPDPAPAQPSGDGSDALDANLRVVNDWGSGAVVELEIINTDQFRFTGGWQVQFDFDTNSISGSWNSDWNAPSANEITVSDVGWNGSLNAGQTVSVGFQLNQGNLDEGLLNEEAEFQFF
ncbi:MAG: cellulase family glycosylhydrolase [Pseudomonadota bacterium]